MGRGRHILAREDAQHYAYLTRMTSLPEYAVFQAVALRRVFLRVAQGG